MASKYTIPMVLLLSLISLQLIKLGHGNGVHTTIHCLEFEREALLGVARGFNQTEDPFSSWVGKNCCQWEGVYCNNTTGHITGLEVWGFSGKMNRSLLGLKHLNYLSLGGNISIPPFIDDFKGLRSLKLGTSNYGGTMPQKLGNLSSLQSLCLYPYDELIIDNAHWLSCLTSLQELEMEGVRFGTASGWLDALNMLPSLHSIYFFDCEFDSFPLSLAHVNFTSLSDLYLESSSTKSRIPSWLFQLSNLQNLDLSYTDFQGPIPAAIGNLTSLESLHLSGTSQLSTGLPQTLSSLCKLRSLYFFESRFNQRLDDLGRCFSGCIRNSLNELYLSDASLYGNLPDWIAGLKNLTNLDLSMNLLSGNLDWIAGLKNLTYLDLSMNLLSGNLDWIAGLKNLTYLYLSMNSLSGPLPKSLGQLSWLAYLDLSHNSLQGELTEEHFANLTRLKSFAVKFNFLVLNVSSDWIPPFQLESIGMSSCLVGPKFPSWLRTQRTFAKLYLSNSGILGSIPEWLWNLTSLEVLDLSHNVISSTIPHFPSKILSLNLMNTSFHGPIPPNISKIFPNLEALFLSTNSINGSIPLSSCDLVNLQMLDISNNNLSGELPPCEKHFPKYLTFLLLSNNNIMGGIPSWLCSPFSLYFLHLSNNNMSGDFPSSLRSCEELIGLDLGGNRFSGKIPTWIAESLPYLERLRLRSNMFVGEIPEELSQIKNLHVIDLSHNNFSGAIPRRFGNFFLMQSLDPKRWLSVSGPVMYYFRWIIPEGYTDKMILDTGGREDLYERRPLALITIMDLSENNLSQSIPEELISLPALMSLNLSGNHLTGEISRKIGNMLQLDSLDLSTNELSGAIPSTLTNLSFLSFLNLSYNNLSGRIPIGRQLDTINSPSSYIGNPFLCGLPLMKTCEGDGMIDGVPKDADGECEDEMVWFYLGIAPGYAVGFWTILGILLLNKTWRTAYFQFIDNSYNRISMAILLSFGRLKRRFLQR